MTVPLIQLQNLWPALWERAPARESYGASTLARLHSAAGAASYKDS